MKTLNKLPEMSVTIRKCREMHNYKQDYLAQQLDISTTAYRNLESGITKISLQHVYDIANIYNINLSQLLEFDNSKVWSIDQSVEKLPETQVPNNIMREMILALRLTHEKVLILIDENHDIRNDIKAVAFSVTKLVREIAVLQKKPKQ